MKWYLVLPFVIFAAALLFGAGWFTEWYKSPLSAPLCIGIGADAVQMAVDQFYQTFWLRWLAVGVGAVVAVLGVPLWIGAIVLLKRSKAS